MEAETGSAKFKSEPPRVTASISSKPATARLLTKREEQIVALASDGLSNKVIAWQLAISLGTVKVHLHNAFVKLGIGSRRLLFRVVAS
jgi:two-component system nitrate/nitrite response regulator NarL